MPVEDDQIREIFEHKKDQEQLARQYKQQALDYIESCITSGLGQTGAFDSEPDELRAIKTDL